MHAMGRAEAAQLKSFITRTSRTLPPELRPQGGDRAAAVRLHRHHQQGHLPARRDRRPAVLADQGRRASTSTRWPATATSSSPKPWPPSTAESTGGRTRTSSASTSCPSRRRATRPTPGRRTSRDISAPRRRLPWARCARGAAHRATEDQQGRPAPNRRRVGTTGLETRQEGLARDPMVDQGVIAPKKNLVRPRRWQSTSSG